MAVYIDSVSCDHCIFQVSVDGEMVKVVDLFTDEISLTDLKVSGLYKYFMIPFKFH